MREATRAVHAGLPAPGQGEPFRPGPVLAGPFHVAGEPESAAYAYGRYANPSWTAFERALAELEGGPALVFASGMAATAAVLFSTLRRGDVLVMADDAYFTARVLADAELGQRGVELRMLSTAGGELQRACLEGDALQGAALLWLETPTNPGLDVCDVAALAQAAHGAGALVAVDNSLATPLGQRPLDLGADFSVSSDTKALTGHADLVLGHVALRAPEVLEPLHTWRTRTGGVAGPFETWLAHRSLATLELRLGRQCDSAGRLAALLHARPDVEGVRYPGLPADPAHEVAARQMSRFGPVVGFALEGRARTEAFLAALEVVAEATSFGGLHSSAERRARWAGDDVVEGFVRLSVGCEDVEDLVEDIEQALDASAST